VERERKRVRDSVIGDCFEKRVKQFERASQVAEPVVLGARAGARALQE
jgi:hypothetical protein